MSEHTNTPWRVDSDAVCDIECEDGTVACVTHDRLTTHTRIGRDEALANARHIVHCVNNHERLVEALRNLEVWAPKDMDAAEEARALLAALEAEKGGEL